MSNKNDRWSALSMKGRADLINMYITNGISDLKEMKKHYNSFAPGGPIEVDEYGYPADITPAIVETNYPRENEVWKKADASNADMIQRLKQGSSRVTIPDWEDPRKVATHKMMSAGNYAVGNVQNINGQLFDFTDPKHGFKDHDRAAIDSAIKRGDYVEFDTEGDARYFAEHYKKHYNSFSGEEDTNKSFWQKLLESGQSAKDARVGAVGAQQVRELYNEDKPEEASKLAKKYAKANTTGISLAGGAASTGLLGDLIVTGATTITDTLLDGEYDKLGVNLVKNVAVDVVGHGIIKGLDQYKRIKNLKESYTGVPHRATYEDPHITMDENFHKYNGTIWTTDSPYLAKHYAEDTGKVFKVLTDPSELHILETPKPVKGEYFPWAHLPYTYNSGIKITDSELIDSGILPSIEEGLKFKKAVLSNSNSDKNVELIKNQKFLKGRIGGGKTDNIVENAYIDGFDGVNFYGVYDGPHLKDGYYIDTPTNETVLNPHTPHIVLPENKSKWSLLFSDLDKKTVLKCGGKILTKK